LLMASIIYLPLTLLLMVLDKQAWCHFGLTNMP
jgi:hypothetical protein